MADRLEDLRIEQHLGGRDQVRWLFELAEDSAEQLDAYIELGRVFVAYLGNEVVGHVQLLAMHDNAVEVKSLAVCEDHQRRGIGARLLGHVFDVASAERTSRVVVSTAAASTDNLRFYQRQGFRMLSVDRDVFTPETGYPLPIYIDGIKLRDRIWLDRDVGGWS